MTQITINLLDRIGTINPNIYGHFAEHLGRCIYEGIWVGEDSSIPNTRGIRNDVVAALKKYPDLNSSLDGENQVFKNYWHIGFAADTPNGLMVPVLKNADQKGVLEIAKETAELSKKARDGKLGPADMQGATFTISSVGGIGGTAFSPIVNAPEVAILGVSKSSMKPVWDGKTFVPRLMVPLSLSADHRVIDGALATRFNAYLAQLLGDFRRVML